MRDYVNDTHLSQSLWPTDLSGASWTSLYPMQNVQVETHFHSIWSLCFIVSSNHQNHLFCIIEQCTHRPTTQRWPDRKHTPLYKENSVTIYPNTYILKIDSIIINCINKDERTPITKYRSQNYRHQYIRTFKNRSNNKLHKQGRQKNPNHKIQIRKTIVTNP